jgi:hypothetical protein
MLIMYKLLYSYILFVRPHLLLLTSHPLLPNKSWTVVDCSGLWWTVVDCGGLWWTVVGLY